MIVSERADYVLQVAYRLFKDTFPYKKDFKGYTFPDAWLFRDLMNRDANTLTQKHIEWIRRALLKYQSQIEELGFDFYRINENQIAPTAAYWKTDMVNAKLISLKFTVKDKTQVTAIYRIYSQHKREKAYAELSREQGIELLKTSNPKGFFDLEGCEASWTWNWIDNSAFLNHVCEQLGFPIIQDGNLSLLRNETKEEKQP